LSLPAHLAALEERIRYHFSAPALLDEALTHRSHVNEQPGAFLSHNERLEFLGDAVLTLVVSATIFAAYPGLNEGELTRIRAEVVNEQALARIARRLELGPLLRLGRGEARSGGGDKDSLLANGLEALFGGVFRDGGFVAARQLIESLLAEAITEAVVHKEVVDCKSRLQELLQGQQGLPPRYHLEEVAGPEHQRIYTITVTVGDKSLGSGRGRTKKAAEQSAAREALMHLLPRDGIATEDPPPPAEVLPPLTGKRSS